MDNELDATKLNILGDGWSGGMDPGFITRNEAREALGYPLDPANAAQARRVTAEEIAVVCGRMERALGMLSEAGEVTRAAMARCARSLPALALLSVPITRDAWEPGKAIMLVFHGWRVCHDFDPSTTYTPNDLFSAFSERWSPGDGDLSALDWRPVTASAEGETEAP